MIPLPDPPLRSGAVRLRPWRGGDAPALVAAWSDPEIQRWTGVPAERDLAAAERWIAGDDARRAADLSLDLVVEDGGTVAGEVGLAAFDRVSASAEIGWWTGAEHRGRGLATVAATLLVAWATAELGLRTVRARCDAANPASVAVARAAGATVLL